MVATREHPPRPTTLDFLSVILPEPEENERLELRAFTPDGQTVRAFYRTVRELRDRAGKLRGTHNVYFGMALRQYWDGAIAGDRAHLGRFQCVWQDVDAKCFADGKAGALAAIRAFPLPPSAIVDSGHGYQPYWLLDEPIGLEDEQDARAIMRAIATSLSGSATHPLDAVDDLPRILRVPGTRNLKDSPALPVELTELNSTRYSLADFRREGFFQTESTAAANSGPGAGRLDPANILDGVPKGEQNTTLSRYAWRLVHKGLDIAEGMVLVGAAAAACRESPNAPPGSDPYPAMGNTGWIAIVERAWQKREEEHPEGDGDWCPRCNADCKATIKRQATTITELQGILTTQAGYRQNKAMKLYGNIATSYLNELGNAYSKAQRLDNLEIYAVNVEKKSGESHPSAWRKMKELDEVLGIERQATTQLVNFADQVTGEVTQEFRTSTVVSLPARPSELAQRLVHVTEEDIERAKIRAETRKPSGCPDHPTAGTTRTQSIENRCTECDRLLSQHLRTFQIETVETYTPQASSTGSRTGRFNLKRPRPLNPAHGSGSVLKAREYFPPGGRGAPNERKAEGVKDYTAQVFGSEGREEWGTSA